MEMENHLEKDDGCYDNAEAAFSDDEEELSSKGGAAPGFPRDSPGMEGSPGVPQGWRVPPGFPRDGGFPQDSPGMEHSLLSAQSPPSPGADPAGKSQVFLLQGG